MTSKSIKVVKELIKSYNNHIKSYEQSDCKTSNYYNLVENRNALVELIEAIEDKQ